MKTFRFYRDEKITCWQRNFFEVKAQNPDEAVKIAIANMNDIEESETVNITGHGTLLETVKTIEVEDNRNRPTVELYRDSGELVMDNLKPIKNRAMSYFSDIDARWKGKKIRVKEGHPRANETAVFSHSLNGYDGFGLVFKSDEGKGELFIPSRDLYFIEITNKNEQS